MANKIDEELMNTTANGTTQKRLFVDMDGTLAVFQKLDTLEALYEQGYFLSLPPIFNVLNAVKDIIANNPEIEVHILSAVLSDSKFALEEKNEWLDRHLPELPKENRIFSICGQDKKEFIPNGVGENDYLLDDYTKNLTLWSPPGQGIKLLNGINHTKGTWKGDKFSYDMPFDLLAKQISSVINNQATPDFSLKDKRRYLSGKLSAENSRFDKTIFPSELLDKRADITGDIVYMAREALLSEPQIDSLLSKNSIVSSVLHSLNVSQSRDIYDTVKRVADDRDITSNEIKIDSHVGEWYNIDTYVSEDTGEVYYLMEHTTYGDEAPHIIIDKDYNVIVDDVYNGFDEDSFQEFIGFERLQSLSKYPLKGLEENAGYYILEKNKDYALAYNPKAPSPYVVWDCDIKGGYCNGRYSFSLESLNISEYGFDEARLCNMANAKDEYKQFKPHFKPRNETSPTALPTAPAPTAEVKKPISLNKVDGISYD